jgi:hypothetical protein
VRVRSFDLPARLRACQHACVSAFLRACLSAWPSRNLGLAPCALLCEVWVLTDSVGRTLILNSSAVGLPFRVRFCQIIRARDPKFVCSVARRDVRVSLLVTRRAEKGRVVTALKCRIHCFDSYLIPFRNRAVIMRLLCLHGDRRGGIFGRRLFDPVMY